MTIVFRFFNTDRLSHSFDQRVHKYFLLLNVFIFSLVIDYTFFKQPNFCFQPGLFSIFGNINSILFKLLFIEYLLIVYQVLSVLSAQCPIIILIFIQMYLLASKHHQFATFCAIKSIHNIN